MTERRTFLFSLGILFFAGVVDNLSTHVALKLGFTESNVVQSYIISNFGIWASLLFETTGLACLASISSLLYFAEAKQAIMHTRLMNTYLATVCVSNALTIVGILPK